MTETIGQRIRTQRRAQHLQQQVLAARVGITASSLSQIECSRVDPQSFTLKCLALALGVSSDYLLGLTDRPTA